MMVIVPDSLNRAINEKLDVAISECPAAAPDRDHFYRYLLSYFNEHGVVPEFTIVKREDAP